MNSRHRENRVLILLAGALVVAAAYAAWGWLAG